METNVFVGLKWAFLVVFGGAGVVLLVIGLRLGVKEHRFVREGSTVQGRVVAFVGLGNSDVRHGKGARVYPVVEFDDGTGRTQQFQDPSDVRDDSYSIGAAVKVAYVPGDLSTARIRTGNELSDWFGFVWVGLLLVLIAVGIFAVASDFTQLGLVVQSLLYFHVGGTVWALVLPSLTEPARAAWPARVAATILVVGGVISLLRAFSSSPSAGEVLDSSLAEHVLRPGAAVEAWEHLFFGAWLAGIAGLVGAAILASEMPNLVAAAVVFGFSLLGLSFAGGAVRKVRLERWHGWPALVLERPQIAAGETFTAELRRGGKAPELQRGTATVRCVDHYTRSKTDYWPVAWEEARPFSAAAGQLRVPVSGQIKAGVPRAGGPQQGYYLGRAWKLVVRGKSRGPGFEAEFHLPVVEAQPPTARQRPN